MDGVDDFAKDYQPQSSQYSRQFMWLNAKGKGHVLRCSIKYIMLPSTQLLKYIGFAFAQSYKYVHILILCTYTYILWDCHLYLVPYLNKAITPDNEYTYNFKIVLFLVKMKNLDVKPADTMDRPGHREVALSITGRVTPVSQAASVRLLPLFLI